jgi:hypothetical protein
MQPEIEETREVLRTARSAAPEMLPRAQMGRPAALGADARFDHQSRDQALLIDCGDVVWAAIVQTNTKAFDPQDVTGWPSACIVIGTDGAFDDASREMLAVAQALYGLKGTRTTPGLQVFAGGLADEMVAGSKHEVPRELSGPAAAAPEEPEAFIRRPWAFWTLLTGGLLLLGPLTAMASMAPSASAWQRLSASFSSVCQRSCSRSAAT